ncbi:hypothetical protein LZ30DRAFT_771703 [Colletotrichum cereale]|nr:hypothetical protein LZ30DRAFT_771703 [Colletotrichum cereale]
MAQAYNQKRDIMREQWQDRLDGMLKRRIKADGAGDAPKEHGDLSHSAHHTSTKPITPGVWPAKTRLVKGDIEEAPDPNYPLSTIERISLDLASVNKAIGTNPPNEESTRSVIDGIEKTLRLIREILDKQQTEAKVTEGFEAIKKQLNGLRTNDSAVLIEKMNTCEMAIETSTSEIQRSLASVSKKVDFATLEIDSMKNNVIEDESIESTAQRIFEKFEKGLDGWKNEVIILLQREEAGCDSTQRMRDLETRLAGIVKKNAAETVEGPLDQLKRSVDDVANKSILMLGMQNKIHQNEVAANNAEIEKLRAEVGRLAKENQEMEKKNKTGAFTIAALRLESDVASSEARTTAVGAQALRQKLEALEEERSKWEAAAIKAREESAAMKSHSAVSTRLVEALGKIESGLREDFQTGNALIKAAKAKLFDIDAATRVETTIKALMEGNQQAGNNRHEELLKLIKDNALVQEESSRGRRRPDSAKVSDREVFDEVLESPWAGPTTRTIRNLAKFAVTHDQGSRESISHSVVYRNIPGNEYCLFAVLEKKDGEAAGAIRSRDCPDHKDRDDCLVTRCQASAKGLGKTCTVLNPEMN